MQLLKAALHFLWSDGFCSVVQDLIKPRQEGDDGDGSRQNVADRFGHKDGEHRLRQDVGQEEDQGEEQDELRDGRMFDDVQALEGYLESLSS